MFQEVLEDMVELFVLCQGAFQDVVHVIYGLRVHDEVYTFVEGYHVVHGPKIIAKEDYKHISSDMHRKLGQILNHVVRYSIGSVKCFIHNDDVINMKPHILKSMTN